MIGVDQLDPDKLALWLLAATVVFVAAAVVAFFVVRPRQWISGLIATGLAVFVGVQWWNQWAVT